ncbi:hypothetical protein K2173_026968 [Erythroxylum novogranatense]|uniref:Uncharacterized protein n=1 Tax=Erythroxylum novogranatense TaxID=1862640 RepID=A0AAV8TXP9_9ROSI|nr:hypothetical protein K2173_026968 [Erythroxylum novogranatense]
MSLITGSSKDSWHPVMTADTTIASYWMNWRFFLCVMWVLFLMTISLILIRKKENCSRKECDSGGETKQETGSFFYDDETWRPCLKGIHPAWLLLFRCSAFIVLLVLLIVAVFVNGGSIFYYYTQWTVASVTIYFGLGSILSMHGCYQYHKRVGGDKVDHVDVDTEQGMNFSPGSGESCNLSMARKNLNSVIEGLDVRQPAGNWAHLFHVIFQINAGTVMLTDCVFWFILLPFLAIKDYHLNVLVIGMHTMNAIFLLADTAFNCLPFPWFRIAYFFMWTIVYVIFQWVVHACVKIWWPYPFLDLSSPFSPLWYFAVAAMHIPCYGLFSFIIKLKHALLSRWFPESRCLR